MSKKNDYLATKLFWNVQFIYELYLAELELQSFNLEFNMSQDFRSYRIKNTQNISEFIDRTAYFESISGQTSLYKKITSINQTRSINQYLTHWIYPYKGKFHPQMIRALLNITKIKMGDTILDPFVGSGTTALEAQLLGINCVGVDISAVCRLISNVKTNSISSLDKIFDTYKEFQEMFEKGKDNTEDKQTEHHLIETINKIEDEETRNFFKVAELIAHSDINRRRKKNFIKLFLLNAEKMKVSIMRYDELIKQINLKLGKVEIQNKDARKLSIQSNSIDGIITSPPYSIALDYVENDKHSLTALGYDISKVKEDFIGVRGSGIEKISSYNSDMKQSYDEMNRVLKEGAPCVIIIGNARLNQKEIPTVEMTIEYFKKLGFKLEKNVDKIIFGLYNIMQKENILIFRKEV